MKSSKFEINESPKNITIAYFAKGKKDKPEDNAAFEGFERHA